MRPGGTTLAVKDRRPMRDWSCRLVQEDCSNHLASSARMEANFSGGSLASNFSVSNEIPRNTIDVEGPSNFSLAIGMFSLENSSWM